MGKIKVEKIVKTFNRHSRNANRVLRGVSFDLPDRGLVCIFGKSGSGKTTLLNIIGGLERPDSGKVYIDGECTDGRVDRIRNAKIGFIFQNYYLEKGYTIAGILRNQMKIAGFEDEEEIARRTEAALRLVGMERFRNKRGDALSGGQQQRVAIARAIVKGSDIILADEPTGNLDAENTRKVMEILKEISRTQLVVIVTHEISLIRRYADSHIRMVDGELVEDGEIGEADLSPVDGEGEEDGAQESKSESKGSSTEEKNEDRDSDRGEENKNRNGDETPRTQGVLTTFTKSTAKRNGRLFHLRTVVRRDREDGEKADTAGNVFKQIFMLALAVVMCFFSFTIFEAVRAVTEHKALGEYTVYANLNAYSVLRKTPESYYRSIDFFDTEMQVGRFSYGGMASLSGIEVSYTPKAIEMGEAIPVAYGRLPGKGEVVVSRAMAEALQTQFRLPELHTDKAITLMTFDGTYPITGIVDGDEKMVYLNKEDYVNFLGVYRKISFSDAEEIFFRGPYGAASFTAEILLYDGEIADDMVRVEINRNSLYKMMADTTQADFALNRTNSRLRSTPYAIQLTGSKVYVEQLIMTRDVMDTDVRIYVNGNVLRNIFVYISPNLEALSSTDAPSYFEIRTDGPEQLTALKAELRDMGVTAVNVGAAYEREAEEERKDAAGERYLYLLVIVLLFIIYFFMEKSASIRNSKEYGIYRAIGVNRSNLLFRECVGAVVHNVLSFLAFSAAAVTLVAVRYAIMNVSAAGFVALAAVGCAIGACLMVGISLIPYLFVLTQSPSEILVRYDI